MNVTHRRMLYGFFFLVFFIAAPIVLLLAQGYRYDFSRRSLYKTSLVSLDVEPEPRSVFVDGESFRVSGTPLLIQPLPPGDHLLRLESPGYHPWEQRITTRSGVATTVDGIRLWRAAQPTLIADNVRGFSQATERPLLVLLRDAQPVLQFLDLQTLSATPLLEASEHAPVEALWSPHDTHLAVHFADNSLRVFLLNAESQPSELALPLFSPSRVSWDESNPTNLLLLVNGSLISYNILSHQQAVIENNVLAWIDDGSNRLLLKLSPDRLATLVMASGEQLVELPMVSDPLFLPSPNSFPTIFDRAEQRLYLIDRSGAPGSIRTFHDVTFAAWSPENNELVYGNSSEFSFFDRHDQTMELLDRSSEPYNGVWWSGQPGHLFVSRQNTLEVFSFLEILSHQATTLLSRPVDHVALEHNEDALIVLSQGEVLRLPLFDR